VGPDGTVYVGWRDRNDPPAVNHIVVARSSDGGMTWTRSEAGVAAAPAVKSGGGFPRLAIDPRNGALALVYQAASPSGTSIAFQGSTDHGATWSDPVTVNDDPSGTGVPHDGPQVFVGPGGRINAVWLDQRDSNPTPAAAKASGQGDIYWASSTDGGKTFSANRRITDRSIDMDAGLIGRIGSYTWYGPAGVATGDSSMLMAWGDPRFGDVNTDTQGISLATVRLGVAGPPPVDTTIPRVSPTNLSVALSRLAYPGGAEEIGGQASSKVVVVNESDTGSALAGAVLARANSGPLLLSPAGGLTKALHDEVARMRPSGAYVIGDASSLSSKVTTDLKAAGVHGPVTRLAGANPAATAAAVAAAVDAGGPQSSFPKGPVVRPEAVVVNPSSSDAATASALAAAEREPVLFAGPGSVPAPTAEALHSLGVHSTLVIGGPADISDAVVRQLPSAKRLGGKDTAATSAAVAAESVARGLPANVVYVTDQADPMDGAMLGATAARLGGLLLTTAGGSTSAAMATIDQLHTAPKVDRLVVARSSRPSSVPWLPIGIFVALAVAGIVLLILARSRRRARPKAPVTS
jgi:putative cell wall-binding protein